MKKPICTKCHNKIKGFKHAKYKVNTIVKPVYWCERCWIEEGRPLRVKVV